MWFSVTSVGPRIKQKLRVEPPTDVAQQSPAAAPFVLRLLLLGLVESDASGLLAAAVLLLPLV